MKLIHVISGLGVGGAESFLLRLLPKLAAHGYRQTVVSLTGRGALADAIESCGVEVAALRMPRDLLRLASLLRHLKPGIVQGWMYHGDLFAALAHRLAGGPGDLVWGIRCSDMDLSRYSLQLRMVVRSCATLSRWPALVIANSNTGAEVHRQLGYIPKRIEIVPNGVDTDVFKPDAAVRAAVRQELAIPDSASVAMHVARVDAMKDHPTLLAAFAATPDVTGILIGAGTETLKYPPNVRALGRRSDVARLLAAADLIVSSSAFGEGFPNAVAEGMSCGAIPVVTDVGDSRLLADGIGAIVARRDSVALARAIRDIMSWPADRRQTAGFAARNHILANYTLDRAADRFNKLYETLR